MCRLASAAALLTLALAAHASADSIAYIKGGDVWLSTPDGARQQQVTRAGTYSYVSQADDGTMIALAPGERLHKRSRTGAVLADFNAYVSDGGPVSPFQGPFNPQISPDGSKVAFEWFNLLRSFSSAVFTDDAVFTKLGGALDPWFFDDQQGFGVDDVELWRDLSTVVGIAGQNDEKLRVYRTVVSPFGAPDGNHQPFYTGSQRVAERCYELDGSFESTTLAPAGALAYGTPEGFFVASIPAGCAPGDLGTLLAAGARSPDRGPADVPPASAFTGTPSARRQAVRARSRQAQAARRGHGQGHAHRARARPRVGRAQAQGPHDRLGEQDGQGRRQGDAAGQAQAALARQGDRQRHLQARGRRRYADRKRVREAAMRPQMRAPVNEPVRLIARSPNVSR